jgi:hypothetical protein
VQQGMDVGKGEEGNKGVPPYIGGCWGVLYMGGGWMYGFWCVVVPINPFVE